MYLICYFPVAHQSIKYINYLAGSRYFIANTPSYSSHNCFLFFSSSIFSSNLSSFAFGLWATEPFGLHPVGRDMPLHSLRCRAQVQDSRRQRRQRGAKKGNEWAVIPPKSGSREIYRRRRTGQPELKIWAIKSPRACSHARSSEWRNF